MKNTLSKQNVSKRQSCENSPENSRKFICGASHDSFRSNKVQGFKVHVCNAQACKARAFTLIEMVIVITIVAILSISMAFSFSGARDRANFADQELEILNIIQEARGLSLSNLQMDDGWVPDYYELSVAEDSLEIVAHTYDEDEDEEQVEIYELFSGFTLADNVSFYYIPPYGEVCIDPPPCESDGETEQVFSLISPEGEETQFTISIFGGYPEVERVEE